MIKYFLYLFLIYAVIKIYRNKLKFDENIIYSSLSIFIGIIIINWMIPDYNNNKDDNKKP